MFSWKWFWILFWIGFVLGMLAVDNNDTYQPRTTGGQDWGIR